MGDSAKKSNAKKFSEYSMICSHRLFIALDVSLTFISSMAGWVSVDFNKLIYKVVDLIFE